MTEDQKAMLDIQALTDTEQVKNYTPVQKDTLIQAQAAVILRLLKDNEEYRNSNIALSLAISMKK